MEKKNALLIGAVTITIIITAGSGIYLAKQKKQRQISTPTVIGNQENDQSIGSGSANQKDDFIDGESENIDPSTTDQSPLLGD